MPAPPWWPIRDPEFGPLNEAYLDAIAGKGGGHNRCRLPILTEKPGTNAAFSLIVWLVGDWQVPRIHAPCGSDEKWRRGESDPYLRGERPLLACFMGGEDAMPGRDELVAADLPDYPAPGCAVTALKAMCDYTLA